MSEFKFSCPQCGQHLKCDEQLSGRQIQCPQCHHVIRIPPVPGKTVQYTPESGATWATFVSSGAAEAPKGVKLQPKSEPPKPPAP